MCLAVGCLHPDFLLQALTARQWQDWVEFASVEPIGEDREDFRTAYAAAGLASCWAEKVKVENFLVDWWKPPVQTLSLDERYKIAALRRIAHYTKQEKRKGVNHGNGNPRNVGDMGGKNVG